ncbi:MAG: cysteine desulfurase family protein, partial [Thermoanaerobaculia bacterium]
MRIYLDNNATTAIHPEVLDVLNHHFRVTFGNASSIHQDGQSARRVIEKAREEVSALLHATPREVVFTSGGTESNNAAIFGAAMTRSGRCHVVTSSIEHPSVLEACRRLERNGHPLTVVDCDSRGVVPAEAIAEALRDDTGLVALMLANNETGVLQPVAVVGEICRSRGIHFHCDAVQGAGRFPLDVEAIGATTLTVTAHKIHGPKGIGALFVRSGCVLKPLLSGGAQERRRRAGTESVP